MRSAKPIICLIYVLILFASVGNAWGERQVARNVSAGDSPQRIEQDGWEEEDPPDESWTWFGMGYESRKPSIDGIASNRIRKADN